MEADPVPVWRPKLVFAASGREEKTGRRKVGLCLP